MRGRGGRSQGMTQLGPGGEGVKSRETMRGKGGRSQGMTQLGPGGEGVKSR